MFSELIGLLVVDQGKYAQYREEMTRLLTTAGGKFRYDFEIARTLKSEAAHDINRLFMIEFPDHAARDRFFSNPKYVEIRTRLFEQAVKGRTTIAEYAN